MSKADAPKRRRILVRNTVHICDECLAALDVLQRRFVYLSEHLRALGNEQFVAVADEAVKDAVVVQRAIDALQEVRDLKKAIEVPEFGE